MFLPVALLVTSGIVILLWGEALRPPPNPPPAFPFSRHKDTLAKNFPTYFFMYIYIHKK